MHHKFDYLGEQARDADSKKKNLIQSTNTKKGVRKFNE